ncbi:pseudaminic acid biosynthesis-associated methylase [Leptospira vanthielii]|uniref:Pseudaminic acid biosynthesis-associated methylase n=1 Tax=Leptospira vanthielii serovar Holland str. Waz Holland = ATCC 700522 TaxID=1218591 RepID=N1WCK4_9LEPT|nr:pseudaminic acid biosynthesis-associated methylase [Leptospira vanthielii]EMY69566.1 pseudaminic acid biosynthesis-associated methylase [Leptospira vanthielii serovar Holland str. Waz Holland = ATCC 700522]
MTKFQTSQEEFWAGEFGKDYIERNQSDQLLASNLCFFSKILENTAALASCIEFGANIGMNLRALKLLQPSIQQYGIEINSVATGILRKLIGSENVFEGSIFDYSPKEKYDLAFIKGVLIHINPEMLPSVYQKIYDSSNRYILIAEYYNPSPVSIPYRGHEDRLFKRDFAGEMLSKFDNLELRDYGFAYKKDPLFPQDDITWFLMEKR